ncbi:hypothetical protein B0H13DRAFT_2274040 [Mycena leptocephala]|nr:hypothetical protein B0H13DRAFT_2274040 [Mycena leptocephala]
MFNFPLEKFRRSKGGLSNREPTEWIFTTMSPRTLFISSPSALSAQLPDSTPSNAECRRDPGREKQSEDRAISGRLSPPSSHGFEMTLLTAKIPKPCPAARSCSFRMPRKFWGGRNSFKSSPRGPTWCSFKPAATKCSADVAGEIFSSRRSPNIKMDPQCYAKSQDMPVRIYGADRVQLYDAAVMEHSQKSEGPDNSKWKGSSQM